VLAYAAVAVWTRRRQWLGSVRLGDVSLGIGLGLLTTLVLEALNLYVGENWSYLSDMPTISGIGILLILQWIALPLLRLWLARRHLDWTPRCGFSTVIVWATRAPIVDRRRTACERGRRGQEHRSQGEATRGPDDHARLPSVQAASAP